MATNSVSGSIDLTNTDNDSASVVINTNSNNDGRLQIVGAAGDVRQALGPGEFLDTDKDDAENLILGTLNGEIDGARIKVLGPNEVEIYLVGEGGSEDKVNLSGDQVEALLSAEFGNNFIIGSDGVVRDRDMDSLDILDETEQHVTLVVNDDFGSKFTESLKLSFYEKGKVGELGKALKGSNLDARKGREGDDLERLLDEAFESDGFGLDKAGTNMVGVEVIDGETVKLSFTVDDVTDTVTLTGDYIDGYLDQKFAGTNAVFDNGKQVGLREGAFNADDNVSENATLIVNVAGPDDIKFGFGTDIKLLVNDINKGVNLDHRDTTDDLTYLVQALFKPEGETVSDRVSGEQINEDTVVISIEGEDGAVDTLTLTGDYIEDLIA
ncbi:MAG: hypothetical protein AAF724_13705 [Pseudomonadota bacterium]